MKNQKKRVLLGMSGGVDSSVAAALLKKRGYDVIGITMQLVPKETEKQSACCNLNSINDAKRVASQLNIPHYTINIRDDFKHYVIDTFVSEYLMGHTPNPCVECNRFIKFDALQQKAKELNADFVATGHYCKITHNNSKKRFFIKKAKDLHKDQSYFLYMLSQEQLSKTLFPLGTYLKSEIRDLAESFDLINAKTKESQDICFITSGNYKAFIDSQLAPSSDFSGSIVDMNGTKLGTHQGIHHFTIGQRKGLNISHHSPLYVIKLNAKTKEVIVGTKDALATESLTLTRYHIVNPDILKLNKSYSIKVRYQMVPFSGKILSVTEKHIQIKTTSPLKFISPGQSCVIYDQDTVIGGGIISK